MHFPISCLNVVVSNFKFSCNDAYCSDGSPVTRVELLPV